MSEAELAKEVLATFTEVHPSPIVDESVPRFEPYDPYEHQDYERTWTTGFSLLTPNHFYRLQTRARFPWIRFNRY